MRKILPYLLVLLALTAGSSLLAQAGGGLADKVQEDLDRTDQLIQQAEEQLQTMENPTGLAFLEQAKVAQQQAKSVFAENRFIEARRLTLLARDLLRKALKSNRATERGGDQALRKLERAEEKLERAREMLIGNENQALNALLESSLDNLKRGWEFYNTNQFQPAGRLAEQAEKAADRILGSGAGNLSANYERRLESVREAVDQAKAVVADCQSEQGKSLMLQAEKSLELAEQLESNGRTPAAMQALQRTKTLASRAFRECNGYDNLSARYQRLLGQADQLKDRSQTLSGETRESVDLLLTKAYEQLELASVAIEASDLEKATPALQAAQLALRQAEDIILESN
ncbi:MAG: hypothetical protein IPH75_06710 [bacterium]|nr:hypothetical protein [bacterium]